MKQLLIDNFFDKGVQIYAGQLWELLGDEMASELFLSLKQPLMESMVRLVVLYNINNAT
jgi:hypothetical protein